MPLPTDAIPINKLPQDAVPINSGMPADAVPISKQGPKPEEMLKQFAIGAVNAAAFNIPEAVNPEGFAQLESKNQIERIARGTGTLVGSVVGVPMGVAKLGTYIATKGLAKTAPKIIRLANLANKITTTNKLYKNAQTAKVALNAVEGSVASTLFNVLDPTTTAEEKGKALPASIVGGALLGGGIEKATQALSKISRAQRVGKLVDGGDATKKLNAMIRGDTRDIPNINFKDSYKGFQKTIIDRLYPLRWLQEQVEEQGVRLRFMDKPYEAARNFFGVGGKIVSKVNNLSANIKFLEPYKAEFGKYLIAKRMIERAEKGFKNPMGLTKLDVETALTDSKNALGENVWRQFEKGEEFIRRRLQKELLNLRNAGVVSKEKYAELIKENPMYLPFDVIRDDISSIEKFFNSKGFTQGTPGFLQKTVGTEREIGNAFDAVVDYITKATTIAEKNRVLNKVVGLKNINPSANNIFIEATHTSTAPKGFQSVSLFQDGSKKTFYMPNEIADVLKGMDEQSYDMFTRMAAASSRALRLGATTYNIAFAARNLIRDFQTANLVSKYGINPIDVARGAASAFKKDDLYEKFLMSGASFSGMAQRTGGIGQSKLFPTISDKAMTLVNPLHWLERVSEISENATRLGVFKKALDKGHTLQEAAFMTRNATIDYAKHGTMMKMVNMLVPFLNARTQGVANILKSAKDNPLKFGMVSTGLVGLPLTTTFMWNANQFPDVWDDIAQFEKDENFILIFGREKDKEGKYTNILRIPKGDVGKALGNPIESFLEYWKFQDPIDFQKEAIEIVNGLSPIEFMQDGKISVSRILSGTTPPPLKAMVEWTTNRNLFTERAIVPESMEGAKPFEQYTEKTSEVAKDIGRMFDVSPMKIENTLTTLFGGAARTGLTIGQDSSLGLKRSFFEVYGNQESNNMHDILDLIEEDSTTERVIRTREIMNIAKEFLSLPPDNKIRVDFLKDKFKTKQEFEKFANIVFEDQRSGIKKRLQSASSIDRVKFIQQYVMTLRNNQEKEDFLRWTIENKILTESVLKKYAETLK